MKIMNFLKYSFIRIFFNPLNGLKKILPDLIETKTDLIKIKTKSDDGIEIITDFFNIVSHWYDKNAIEPIISALENFDFGQFTGFIKYLKILDTHFKNAGRNRYGFNRTEIGEQVTDDKVFLGNIYGYWTKPISYIKQQKEDEEYYQTMSRQAKNFIDSHISGIDDGEDIVKIITILEKNL